MPSPIQPAARALVPLLLAFSTLAACSSSTPAPPEKRVAVLFTTDEHSTVFALAPEVDDWPPATTAGTGALVGGVARRARLIEQQRTAMPETVVLSVGDATQGTLAAVPHALAGFDFQLMKAMGYDAVALGNHEFDLTPVGLAMSVTAATNTARIVGAPQLVLTNLKFSPTSPADDGLAALYGPGKPIAPSHLITTAGGSKIGVVAAMGHSAADDCAPFAAPVTFTNGLPTSLTNSVIASAAMDAIAAQLQPAIDDLRTSGKADLIVLLDHGGYVAGASSQEDEQLALRLSGVDLVLSGHTHEQAPTTVRMAPDKSGRQVPIMQTAAFGAKVGRAELSWHPGERPVLDPSASRTTYLAVDDRILPTDNVDVNVLVGVMMDKLEASSTGLSFLEQTLSLVTGAPVLHDPARLGSLYFYKLGETSFTTQGLGTGESNILNLDTDAMRAAANALGGPTQVALQARGAMRADLVPGKTGVLSFADVYRVSPLGIDPESQTPGYPILRFALSPAELRAAIEGTLQFAIQNEDFFLSPSGLKVTYDRTRAPLDFADPGGPGWTTQIATVASDGTETVWFDVMDEANPAGWLIDPTDPATFLTVTTTYFVASFASTVGIMPRDPATLAQVPPAGFPGLFVRWPAAYGSSAVKDHQALASYVFNACKANGGTLPPQYDDASTTVGKYPRRMICTGGFCPP